MREISKEYGINAFEPKELKDKFNEFAKWQTDQKSEQEKLQEKADLLDKEKTEWNKKEIGYQTQIEASKLGIGKDHIEDAMALAGGDPTMLEEIVKKYPMFKSKEVITIGVHGNQQRTPGSKTEAEEYMAKNYQDSPYYHSK